MNFVLSTFSDSLFTASQSDILDSSKLIKYDIWVTSWFTSCVNVHNVVVVTLFSNIIHEQNTSDTNLTNKAYPGYCKHVLCWRPPEKALAYLAGGNVVSSAYKIKLRRSLTVCMSFIHITNNKGPNIEPCGTPVSISFFAEATPSYSTYWVRSER